MAATIGTLLVAVTQLPIAFQNAMRGDGDNRAGLAVLAAMPVLATVLARAAHRAKPRRRWWIAFGVLTLCWAALTLFTLICVGFSQAIQQDGLVT